MDAVEIKKKGRRPHAWPNVYPRDKAGGTRSWIVDMGLMAGKGARQFRKTKKEALTFAEQARIKK